MSTSNFKGIVKLTEEQYEELSTNNTLTTSSGTTITYDPTSTLYITPNIPSELALINKDNQFTVGQTINGNLTVNGDIIQSGSSYETHAEEIYSTKDYIYLREGAVSGLTSGQYSGLEFINYDGTNNGRLVIDNTGTVRVGDVGEERPLAVRGESPIDGGIAIWNNDTKTFDTNNTYTYNNLVIKSNLNNYVDLTSSQNITGQKTFTQELIKSQNTGYSGYSIVNTGYTRGNSVSIEEGLGRFIVKDSDDQYLSYLQTKVDSEGHIITELLTRQATSAGGNSYQTVVLGLIASPSDKWIYSGASIRPGSNNNYDLGTSSYKWRDGYFSDTLTTNEINLTKTGYPNISGTNGVYISSNGNWGGSGGEFCFTSTEFRPSNARSNYQTLGTSTNVWKQGYFGDQGVTIGDCTLSYNSTNSALEFIFE